MSHNPSAQQQAQAQFLTAALPKVKRVDALVEQLAASPGDDHIGRQMIRQLDSLKAGASQLKLTRLADVAGQMAMVARRGGGAQVRLRGLRDLLGALHQSLDLEMRPLHGAAGPEQPGNEPGGR
jgi:chemotaxis protein histidine kinase CheA